ncbi:MAG: DUF2029 domain-containing protein [Myxococcaceae bacterium]|nr:DUF2029 domain-containing protein [Myxococcaceae bacterium]
MNHFISGIIKIIILEAQVGLLLLDAVTRDRFEKQKKIAFIVLSALMVFAWCDYGAFIRNGFTLVHHHEQFHFYLGAKYQAEVGWFDLYRAAVIADAETVRGLRVDQIRDNTTFDLEPTSKAFAERDRIVGRFTPQRWEEFKADWVLLMEPPNKAELNACEQTRCTDPGSMTQCRAACEQARNDAYFQWRARFNGVVQDHGNSNSPAWAVIAHPIARLVPFTPGGQAFLGLIDVALMVVLWWQIFKTFGWKPASIAMLVWAAPPFVFSYLGGSFLRWDWLFALGMACVMMKREKWLYAGLFFGFAVATKLFPLFFGVALGVRALLTCWRDKKVHQKYRQMLAGTVISGTAIVALASIMFGGFWVWPEYQRRMQTTVRERFYSNQYSLRTVYLQWQVSLGCSMSDCRSENLECSAAVCKGCCDPNGRRSIDSLASTWLFPAEMKQGRNDVDVADHQFGLKLFQLLFTLAVFLLVLRTDEIGAFTLGPLLVCVWLVVNAYYWNMLGLVALGLALREGQKPALGALIGLHAMFMTYYLYVHTNRGMSEGYMVALQLLLLIAVFAFFEYRAVKAELMELFGTLSGRKRA